MTVHRLDSPSHLADPGPWLERLRAEGPFVRARLPVIGEVRLATTQAASAALLKDPETFAMRRPDGRLAALKWWLPPIFRALSQSMITADGDDHRRLRGLVDEAFRRRAVLAMEPRIREIADGLADGLFAEGDPADLVSRFARLLPLAAICELLGLPQEDRPLFIAWSQPLLDLRGPRSFLALVSGLRAMRRYLESRIGMAVTGGHDGLIGDLASVEKEGGRLTREEMLSTIFLLLTAGFETTTHLIAGSVHELLLRPQTRSWLMEDEVRLALAVEEMLRFVSPVQATKPRYVARDAVIEGVALKKGEQAMALLASANRDPAVIDRAEEFDPERRPNRHIAFGAGVHFCLGHQFARLEARVAVAALFARHPSLSLAVPPQDVTWRPRAGLRAIEALPVTA